MFLLNDYNVVLSTETTRLLANVASRVKICALYNGNLINFEFWTVGY